MSELKKPKREDFGGTIKPGVAGISWGMGANSFDCMMRFHYAETAYERACKEIAMEALTRLRDCDWVISLPDRMDAVRDIAREALAKIEASEK